MEQQLLLAGSKGQQAWSSWPNAALEVFDGQSAAGAAQPAMQGSCCWTAGPRGDMPSPDRGERGEKVLDGRSNRGRDVYVCFLCCWSCCCTVQRYFWDCYCIILVSFCCLAPMHPTWCTGCSCNLVLRVKPLPHCSIPPLSCWRNIGARAERQTGSEHAAVLLIYFN